MVGLIWIQSVRHSDGILKVFEKLVLDKNQQTIKEHEKLPSRQRDKGLTRPEVIKPFFMLNSAEHENRNVSCS